MKITREQQKTLIAGRQGNLEFTGDVRAGK
jgi:hypothetical protein